LFVFGYTVVAHTTVHQVFMCILVLVTSLGKRLIGSTYRLSGVKTDDCNERVGDGKKQSYFLLFFAFMYKVPPADRQVGLTSTHL